jgi:hypothetical protein
MTDKERIERAMAGIRGASGGRAETEGVSRQAQPERETRPQAEKERHPDYYTRQEGGRSR